MMTITHCGLRTCIAICEVLGEAESEIVSLRSANNQGITRTQTLSRLNTGV